MKLAKMQKMNFYKRLAILVISIVGTFILSFNNLGTSSVSANNSHLTPAATAAPFSCEGVLYQVISGQLRKLDFRSGTYTPVGDYSGFNRINAMGYNLDDNFIYALARQNTTDVNGVSVSEKDIVKIDSNGDVFYHISPRTYIPDSVTADVVNNRLWILKGSNIYKIDLSSGIVERQPLDRSISIVDWGFINGKFYGTRANKLFTVDPSSNPARVTETTVPGLNGGGAYGAAYVFDTDDLYVSSNGGGLYQIINYDTGSPRAFYVSNSEVTSQNDGASCPVAEIIIPRDSYDRGDAPNAYGDATNSIASEISFWIGSPSDNPDEESAAFASVNQADADDTSGIDDEGGITWNFTEDAFYDTGIVFYPGGTYTLNAQLYNDELPTGYFDAWIDFDGNRNFEESERVIRQTIPQRSGSQNLNGLSFSVPSNAACGRTFARFRLSEEGTHLPTGYAGWGEIEDYAITIDCRTDLEPTMEFVPNVPGVNDINFNSGDRTYRGDWELSHNIEVRTFVQNNGPQAARSMTLTVQLPRDMDDVATADIGSWSCSIDAFNVATCNSVGLANGGREEVIEFTGRIPGNYGPNSIQGYARIEHEAVDLDPTNDRVDYDIKVIKEWVGTEDVKPYIYARFSNALTPSSSVVIDRDIEIGGRLAAPIQLPVYYGASIETLSGPPILRTRWCNADLTYTGCDEPTDYIEGTIAIQSHTTISVTEMSRSAAGLTWPLPTSTNLAGSPIETNSAHDASSSPIVRYFEDSYSDCRDWINLFGGKCASKQDDLDISGMPAAQRAFYDYDDLDLTPIVFQTTGGRGINCDNGAGDCVYVEDARPSVYYVEGQVDYQVVFHDPIEKRLPPGTEIPLHTFRQDREEPISFFIQVLGSFVEPNN